MLLAAARAWALLCGRPMVLPEDVQAVFPSVAGHRLAGGARAGALQAQRPAADGARCREPAAAAAAATAAGAGNASARPGRGSALFRHAPTDDRPVVLRHRRIYILPTRGGWAFIGTLLLLLITSLNYALSLGFVVTFLLGGPGRDRAAAHLPQPGGNRAPPACRPVKPSPAVRCRSRSRSTGGACPATPCTSPPREGTDGHHRHPPRGGAAGDARAADPAARPCARWAGSRCRPTIRSGCGAAGPTCTFRSPASSSRRRKRRRRRCRSRAPASPTPDALSRDDADLAGLRDYQPGDPLQRVAWKAVARGAGWYTKQFDGRGGGGPLAFAWTALPGSLDAEQRISRLTAWVLAAERAARPFSLTAPGVALPAGQGRDHRRRALTALALLEVPPR